MKIIKMMILILFGFQVSGQEIMVAKFTVDPGKSTRIDTPVSASLEGLDYNTDKGALKLYEEVGKSRVEVACQLDAGGYNARLCWIMKGETAANTLRKFILVKDSTYQSKSSITTELTPKVLVLKKDGEKVLQYNMAVVFPPDTVNPIFRRSGFIHPLWSPSGNVMTRINAPDHWHHFGIWNPWTHTQFEGHGTDFWNLALGQGTVRFAGINSLINGPVFGGFKVRQEHIDFQCLGGDKVAMNEVWDVRLYSVGSAGTSKVWLWELTTTLNCATDSSVLIEEYRYGGGIGFRANEEWTNKNSWVLTSEGKSRKDADGSRARWCDVGGDFSGNGSSGILFMSNPANREYPEPMRVWPEDSNAGRGDMFFEFCPIRHKSWTLNPGKEYQLKYRMLVYDGKIDPKTAERLWNDFANPPAVQIIK